MSRSDSSNWRDAVREEMESILDKKTFYDVCAPGGGVGVRVIPTKFIFKLKRHSGGSVAKYKARLVVKGFMQQDVMHTYAPVVDFGTVLKTFKIALCNGYHLHQMDVKTAFLHIDIDSDVYINLPNGFGETESKRKLFKLPKGLYGLKQAPKLWFKKWKSVVAKLGFTQSSTDYCLFNRCEIWMMLYVDDIVLMSRDEAEIENVKKDLHHKLDVKDLGKLTDFLGILLKREIKSIKLSQSYYAAKVLERFGMTYCNAAPSPITVSKNSNVNRGYKADQSLVQEKSDLLCTWTQEQCQIFRLPSICSVGSVTVHPRRT